MKKFLGILLSLTLLITFTPVKSFAGTTVAEPVATADIVKGEPTGTATDPTDEGLQNAILAAKGKVTIPKEYSDFNYYFNDSYNYPNSYWSLYWTNPNTGASISVNVDKDNHITYYAKYDYSSTSRGIAKYLKSELVSVAENFIDKIAPETNGYLELVNSEFTYIYSGDYSYTFQRIKSGVDFPDNTVTVNVNSFTGEVTMASVNWLYGETIPSAKATLTKEDATAKIKENMKMKLVYHSNYYYIYDKGIDSSAKEAFLVYEPSENYISVDAKTGEVYKTRNAWVNTDEAYSSASKDAALMEMVAGNGTTSTVSLTEEEIKKIEELKDLITKSKAIKVITDNKSLYMDDNLTQTSASLNKLDNGSGKTTYVWNINFNDPREITDSDYYRGYAYATVDAQTGKILSYYSSVKSNYDYVKQTWESVKIKYDKEQCKAVLEKFMKAQAKDHFANTVLASETDDYVAYYKKDNTPVYGGYYYVYNRVNNKIEYPDNNMNGAVDGVTGKIYSFGSYWDDSVKFQTSEGVISADQALDYYLGNEGYGLKYEINQVNNYSEKTGITTVDYEIRLVYRPDVNPTYISPYSGEQLNYDGTTYTVTKPFAYKDITNTAENRNILLLADMGIGFEGENFLPNQSVTFDEIKALLKNIGYGYEASEIEDSSQITREKLAQLFIDWLGLNKLSKLNIYDSGYADESSIDSQYVGAVALAKGYNIMTGDSNNKFNPKNNVTRFEAVNMIINFIQVQQNGIYY